MYAALSYAERLFRNTLGSKSKLVFEKRILNFEWMFIHSDTSLLNYSTYSKVIVA